MPRTATIGPARASSKVKTVTTLSLIDKIRTYLQWSSALNELAMKVKNEKWDASRIQKEFLPVAKSFKKKTKAIITVEAVEIIKESSELYCVCQQPYVENVLMLGCDGCNGWFHPTCVGLSNKQAKSLERFLCLGCRPPSPDHGVDTHGNDQGAGKNRTTRRKTLPKPRGTSVGPYGASLLGSSSEEMINTCHLTAKDSYDLFVKFRHKVENPTIPYRHNVVSLSSESESELPVNVPDSAAALPLQADWPQGSATSNPAPSLQASTLNPQSISLSSVTQNPNLLGSINMAHEMNLPSDASTANSSQLLSSYNFQNSNC